MLFPLIRHMSFKSSTNNFDMYRYRKLVTDFRMTNRIALRRRSNRFYGR